MPDVSLLLGVSAGDVKNKAQEYQQAKKSLHGFEVENRLQT
jgi:hypothetical protein